MENLNLNTTSKISGPIQEKERLIIIDILRVFALLGIFIVNIQFYVAEPSDISNNLIIWLIKIFIEGSFFPLFSILFGIGFAIILSRTEVNGKPNRNLFLRRLFFLFVIASLQFIFLEPRHILLRYSMLGILLITFYSASQRILKWSIAIFLIISVFHTQVIHGYDNFKRYYKGTVAAQVKVQDYNTLKKETIKNETIKNEKNNWEDYSDYVIYNSKQLSYRVISLTRESTMPIIFASFLLGIFIWRKGIFQRIHDYRPFLRFCLIFCGLFGLVGNIILLILEGNGLSIANSITFSAIQIFGDYLFTLFYISGIALLSLNKSLIRLLKALIPAGKMGLTNYLLQSVAMSLIFLGYGLNLKGKLTAFESIIVVFLITIMQIMFSEWWLQRFKYGPVEWIWRLLTYGRWLPIRDS